VVEGDEPKKPAKRVTARIEDDDEDDDRPRRKKRQYDDDEDDDRPRSRKRSRGDDDDDEDDDRPRKKKRRSGDEDDDWAESGSRKVTGAGPAKSGMLMVSISFWIQMGVFALMGVFMLVGWLGGFIPFSMMIIPGILGLGASVVAAVGFGLCIGGPPRSRPLAIAGTAVAAVHLILAFVIANNSDAGLFSERGAQRTAVYSKALRIARLAEAAQKDTSRSKTIEEEGKKFFEFLKDNKEDLRAIGYYENRLNAKDKEKDVDVDLLDVLTDDSKGGAKAWSPNDMRWVDVASNLPFLDKFLAVAAYHGKYFGDYFLGFLGGLAELAQLLLAVLLIGSVSKAVRGNEAAGKAKIGLIAVAVAAGVAVLIALLVTVMIEGAKADAKKAAENTSLSPKERMDRQRGAISTAVNAEGMGRTLIFILYSGMLVMPAIAALQASSEAGRRARR
jgi:hypothetical protein